MSSSSSSSSEISCCYPEPLFSNPLQQIGQNVPGLLLMEMEGDINVSTGYINGGEAAPAEKVWTVPRTSFNGDSSLDENGGYIRKIKRACRTGDLQIMMTRERLMIMEEGNLKVGRCNAEERKEKIQRYRVKKKQRNFNKTIKYECRKTLADNRPRIRGRFVSSDIPISSYKDEEYDYLKTDGIFVNESGDHDLGPTMFEYYAWT